MWRKSPKCKVHTEAELVPPNSSYGRDHEDYYENDISNCEYICYCSSLIDKLYSLKVSNLSNCIDSALNLSVRNDFREQSVIQDNNCAKKRRLRELTYGAHNMYDNCSNAEYDSIISNREIISDLNSDAGIYESITSDFDFNFGSLENTNKINNHKLEKFDYNSSGTILAVPLDLHKSSSSITSSHSNCNLISGLDSLITENKEYNRDYSGIRHDNKFARYEYFPFVTDETYEHLGETRFGKVIFETENTLLLDKSQSIAKPSQNKIVSVEYEETETMLPLKKRKLSIANNQGEELNESFAKREVVEDKRKARGKVAVKDISYPAKPMMSIAEIQDKLPKQFPSFCNTLVKMVEIPTTPLGVQQEHNSSVHVVSNVTEQTNNHTFRSPNVCYQFNDVEYPYIQYAHMPYKHSYSMPMNGSSTFHRNISHRT